MDFKKTMEFIEYFKSERHNNAQIYRTDEKEIVLSSEFKDEWGNIDRAFSHISMDIIKIALEQGFDKAIETYDAEEEKRELERFNRQKLKYYKEIRDAIERRKRKINEIEIEFQLILDSEPEDTELEWYNKKEKISNLLR